MWVQQSLHVASSQYTMAQAEKIQPRPYLKLLILAALLGLICAAITFAFVALVHNSTQLLWEQASHAVGLSLPIFTILVCATGGLDLCQHLVHRRGVQMYARRALIIECQTGLRHRL